MKQRFSTRTRLVSALLTLAMVFTFLPISAFAAEEGRVPIGEDNYGPFYFPDSTFRTYLRKFDKNKDDYLSKTELDAIKEINVGAKKITNLQGINFFPNLEKLDCNNNQLTTLNVTSNLNLKQLYCYANQLTELNVWENDQLTELYCSNNYLTSLDLRYNTELTKLSCYGNNLTSLDVSKNPALEQLSCRNNQLTSLDVRKNTKLTVLDCARNQLTSLDVSKNEKLEELYYDYNQLTSLQADNCTNLHIIGDLDNEYSVQVYESTRVLDPGTLPGNFDISRVRNLTGATKNADGTMTVKAGGGKVTYEYRFLSDNYAPFTLNVEFIPDGSIVINASNFPDPVFREYLLNANLYLTSTKIDKDSNGILSEKERNAVETIKIIDGYNGQKLTSLQGIEFFPNLLYLYCGENNLTSLNVSKNKKLEELHCDENNLNSLDVSQNTALLDLNCSQNNLTSLDVRNNAALRYLWCWKNQLTSLDVSNNPELKFLNCDQNQLTSLNVEKTSIYLSNPYSGFHAKNNTYPITVGSDRTFNLSTLPGFDVTKATNWSGGIVSGKKLKVNEGVDQVTYTYDCGKGCSATFTLNVTVVPDGTVTPPSGGDTPGGTTPGGSTPGGSTGGGDGGGGGAVILLAGGAALLGGIGIGVYNYVTNAQLKALLPAGTPVPQTRGETALLLWNTAGRPHPIGTPAFVDVADPDTAKAAQWCVEAGIMDWKSNDHFAPDKSISRSKVLKAYKKLVG